MWLVTAEGLVFFTQSQLHDRLKGGKNMAYFPPVPAVRRNHIITRLKQSHAVSKETAVTLSEAGVNNPDSFIKITELLCRRGILIQTGNRYYLGIRYE